MNTKDLFWEDIAIKLESSYALNSPPSEWKKGEIEVFLKHFTEKITVFRSANNIEPADDVKISYDTFRRILIKKETKGSDYTRNLFAQYFGEKSYLDYVQKLEEKSALNQKADGKKGLFTAIWLFLGICTIIIGLYVFNSSQKEKSTCKEIRSVIEGAIATEFNTYKSIPNADTNVEKLKEYFYADQNAYKKILRVINNETIRKWVLSNESNISSATLLDFECQYVDSDLASVTTKEHWNIQWYDTNINEYAYIYDTVNTQTYYLKKKDDNWKITVNSYDTEKDKVFVKIANHDKEFNKSIRKEELKRIVVEYMSNGDAQNALWWLLNYAKINNLAQLEEITLLSGNQHRNIRRVNTNEIKLSKYYELQKEIDAEIFKVLKQL